MGKKHNTTVTFLEMQAKSQAQLFARPEGKLAIIRAEKPPLHFYRYLYDVIGREHMWVHRKRLSDSQLEQIIHDDDIEIYLLYVNGVPAGFAELDFRNMPRAELIFLGLMPEFIGRGYGQFLLHSVIDIAWSRPIERLRVQTNTLDHPRAIILYQKWGFSPYAQQQAELEEADE